MTNSQKLAWAMALDYAQRLNAQMENGNSVFCEGEKLSELFDIDSEARRISHGRGRNMYVLHDDSKSIADVRDFWTLRFEVYKKVDWQ